MTTLVRTSWFMQLHDAIRNSGVFLEMAQVGAEVVGAKRPPAHPAEWLGSQPSACPMARARLRIRVGVVGLMLSRPTQADADAARGHDKAHPWSAAAPAVTLASEMPTGTVL